MVPLRIQRTLSLCSLLPFLRFSLKMTSCFLLRLYVASFAFLISQIRLKHMTWEVIKKGKTVRFVCLLVDPDAACGQPEPQNRPQMEVPVLVLVSTRTRTVGFAAASFFILTEACPSEEASVQACRTLASPGTRTAGSTHTAAA